MRIDLHTHTTASDGTAAPAEVVAAAAAAGVGVLGICDHDTTNGVDAALAAGTVHGVEVWPGVELSCDTESGEVHVLGYFIDHRLPWLQALLARLRDGRVRRMERMLERLAALGVSLDPGRVRALAGAGAIGRPHVARALVEAGLVRSVNDAFDRYLGRHRPAYVERLKIAPAQSVELVQAAGGVAVLAHPGWGVPDDLIVDLAGSGLDGIEVYYPEHTPAQVLHYLGVANRLGLMCTGGTDYHGGGIATRAAIGSQYVPESVLEPLRTARANRVVRRETPAIDLRAE